MPLSQIRYARIGGAIHQRPGAKYATNRGAPSIELSTTCWREFPCSRSIYRPVSQVVRLFAGSNADLTGLPVVMCRLGGDQGVDVPALLAAEAVFDVGGDRRLLVYLPTSPLPAWGGLLLVPQSAVIHVRDMDADALIKLYISFGVLAPEVIPLAAQA